MDYRIYDPVLYPVFILANDETILHANPAGLFWLSKMTNYQLSGFLRDHVAFTGLDFQQMIKEAPVLQRFPYRNTHFRLIHRAHDGYCDVTAMKISGNNDHYNFAVFVYDKSTIQESEAIAAATIAAPAPAPEEVPGSPVGLAVNPQPAGATQQTSGIFSADALKTFLPAERMASLITKVNLFCAELKLPIAGQTVWVSDTWIEAIVKKVGLQPGYTCSLEIADLDGHGPFACKVKVVQVTDHLVDDQVRFQFESLSALNKRSLESYLDKNLGK